MIKENGIKIKDGLYEFLEYLQTTTIKKDVATSTSRKRGIGLLKMADHNAGMVSIMIPDMQEPDENVLSSDSLVREICLRGRSYFIRYQY